MFQFFFFIFVAVSTSFWSILFFPVIERNIFFYEGRNDFWIFEIKYLPSFNLDIDISDNFSNRMLVISTKRLRYRWTLNSFSNWRNYFDRHKLNINVSLSCYKVKVLRNDFNLLHWTGVTFLLSYIFARLISLEVVVCSIIRCITLYLDRVVEKTVFSLFFNINNLLTKGYFFEKDHFSNLDYFFKEFSKNFYSFFLLEAKGISFVWYRIWSDWSS